MMPSESLQALMVRLLQSRRALPRDPELTRLAALHFTGSARLSPVEQLEIYRQQFWLRHTAALLEDFPGVAGIVGQRAWERLAEEYLQAHPPTSFTLRDLGAKLPEYIERSADWLDEQRLVGDMARLEWAYVEVFDAPEPTPLAPEKLAALDEAAWAEARLSLSPALRLLRVSYPVVELRKRLLTSTTDGEAVPIPAVEPRRLVVHRAGLVIRAEPLDQAPFALLEALAAGESLSRACEAAAAVSAEKEDHVSASLSAWFEGWVRRRFIVDVAP